LATTAAPLPAGGHALLTKRQEQQRAGQLLPRHACIIMAKRHGVAGRLPPELPGSELPGRVQAGTVDWKNKTRAVCNVIVTHSVEVCRCCMYALFIIL
jgi:hypothetical protein